jgi:excisionase family DNA binding protein
MATNYASPTVDALTEAQRRALAAFDALLAAHGGAPQRLIVIDAEGREAEVSRAVLGDLLPAVAVAARVLAAEAPPDERELTTTQAARWLHVSRQHLVDLLKAGTIPYRMVGAHHRVRLGDLRAFKGRQRAALRAITRIGEALGYDE